VGGDGGPHLPDRGQGKDWLLARTWGRRRTCCAGRTPARGPDTC